MRKGMLLAFLGILIALHCSDKDPVSSKSGGLALQLIFPEMPESVLGKSDAMTIDRIHIVIKDGNGKSVIDKDMKKSGDTFSEDYSLTVGSGYTLSVDCFNGSDLIYQGTASGIKIRANKVTSVEVSLNGVFIGINTSVTALDFGPVILGNTSDKTLRISSTGTATLQISDITTSNAVFTIVGNKAFSISPGNYQDVTIRYTPTSANSSNAILQIQNNSTENVKEVTLTGTGIIGAISVSPNSLEFGSVNLGSLQDKVLRISNTGTAALQVSSMSTTESAFSIVASTSFSITPGNYQDVTIRFTPTTETIYNATLHINNNSTVTVKDVALSGTGISSAISVSPLGLAFGNVMVGLPSEKTLRISNTGSADLQIISITTNDPVYTIIGETSFSIPAGNFRDVTVRFTPSGTTFFPGNLRIINNSPQIEKNVTLDGIGIDTAISVSVSSVDFGPVLVGTYLDRSFRISNTGIAILVVSSLSITDAAFSIEGTNNFGIPPGNFQDVTVRFSPTSDSTYTATLHINNSSAESVKNVSLTGSGTIGTISLSVTTLEFGFVTLGNTSDKSLRISNTGTSNLQISGISSTNGAFTIIGGTSFNISPGNYQDVTVRFTPTSATTYYATLHINNNSAESVKDVTLTGSGTENGSEADSITDIDGNTYKTVQIGNQWWMAENLQVTHYRNGEAIANVTDYRAWTNLITGAFCNYNNNEANVATYGRLYNWYAVNDIRNISPAGWHVPSDEEWKQLEIFLGMSQSVADGSGFRGITEGGKMKESGTSHWLSPNTGANNSSSFTALPGGFRDENGNYQDLGSHANFWSSTEDYSDDDNNDAWYRYLTYGYANICRENYYKRNGFSVRCVRSEGPENAPPFASFNVVPSSGPISTQFQFDASGSTDKEDPTSSLQIRWDWENDGTWDTSYSTTKTATHSYATAGTYTIKLEVKDTGSLTTTTTRQLVVTADNTPPTASFSISPSTGTTATNFQFDASGCTDAQDITNSLQVRWDWTSDGSWDTNYTTTKTATHQFGSAGTYIVTLQVKDTGGLTNTTTKTVEVTNTIYETGTLIDIDGNVYQTIKIGNQWWMAENLKVTHYRNGDAIPNYIDYGLWASPTSGAYCNFNNDELNAAIYGRLYNGLAVLDNRNIAPIDWQIPSDYDWQVLVEYLGGSSVAGGKMMETGIAHWWEPNTVATNESRFTALPGGYRNNAGVYHNLMMWAFFWSSTSKDSANLWFRQILANKSEISRGSIDIQRGLSIRCLRNNASPNIPPFASFSVTPLFGPIPTIFQFNASGSTDPEDTPSALQVHWDWENDGIWDTNLSNIKSTTHQYFTPGNYTIKLEVLDTGGLADTTTRQVTVYETGECADIEGNVYRTVKINNQWWMAENLKVTRFRNGDALSNVSNASEWGNLTTSAFCDYNNDPNYSNTYGHLYNGFAIKDSRNIAPTGWHVPSNSEWHVLFDYLGGEGAAGGKMKEVGTSHWLSPNTGATNESGFTALPGGWRDRGAIHTNYMATFNNLSEYGAFWAQPVNAGMGSFWLLRFDYSNALQGSNYEPSGFSLRCVKD